MSEGLDPLLWFPDDIVKKSIDLDRWMSENGHQEWQLGGCCSRQWALKQQEERDAFKQRNSQLEAMCGRLIGLYVPTDKPHQWFVEMQQAVAEARELLKEGEGV